MSVLVQARISEKASRMLRARARLGAITDSAFVRRAIYRELGLLGQPEPAP